MRSLQQVMPDALARLLRGAALSPAKVSFAWKTAVGPALDRVSNVRLEGRTLLVDAAGPQWTREIARVSGVILPRVQKFLGCEIVDRIVVRTAQPRIPNPESPIPNPQSQA